MMQNYDDLNNNTYTTQDQISDLQKKIHLVEGDLKAYQEQSLDMQGKNKMTIQRLRKECKDLHKALAERLEADAMVIDTAFDNAANRIAKQQISDLSNQENSAENSKRLRNMRIRSADAKERTALRNKSGEDANQRIDLALCDQKKRLNAMKAETLKKKSNLKDLETTYDQLQKEASFSVEMSKGESKSAQKLTLLENRLDIAKRKSAEATHINKVYQLLHQHLQDANLTSPGMLNDLENQIRKSKVELEDIRRMYEDAQKSRDQARTELSQTEERISSQRRVYEKQLNELREQAAKVQRQAKMADFGKRSNHAQTADGAQTEDRMTVFSDRLTKASGTGTGVASRKSEFASPEEKMQTLDEYDQSMIVIEQNQKIDELEKHFQKIKEVTGVSELSMIVARFEDQAKTHAELEDKRRSNIEETERLTRQLFEAKARLNEQKYGNSGSDSKKQVFEKELEVANEDLSLKRKAALELEIKAEDTKKLVNNLSHALANLTEKLERVRLDKSEESSRGAGLLGTFAKPLDPESIDAETIEDLFDRTNKRVDKLLSTLPSSEELDVVLDTAKTDDVYLSALENRMPAHNVRIANLNREGTATTEPADEATAAKPGKKPDQAGRNIGDDSESGEDNADFFSRDQIKKQGTQLIDSRSKKRGTARQRSTKRKGFGFR